MLETTACPIERIAIDLGYASDTALRNTIKRLHQAAGRPEWRRTVTNRSIVVTRL